MKPLLMQFRRVIMMDPWQVEKVLNLEVGQDWRDDWVLVCRYKDGWYCLWREPTSVNDLGRIVESAGDLKKFFGGFTGVGKQIGRQEIPT